MYVDHIYGEVKSVFAHLLLDRSYKDVCMIQSENEPNIWYYPLEKMTSFKYNFSLKIKRSLREKITSALMGYDGLVTEAICRNFAG